MIWRPLLGREKAQWQGGKKTGRARAAVSCRRAYRSPGIDRLRQRAGAIGTGRRPRRRSAVAGKNDTNSSGSETKDDPVKAPLPQDGMHEPFAQATRGGDDPPANSNPPPDVTVSGKPVYKVYKEVLALWDTIRFVTADGKPIHYSATVETDFGNIEIALRPDLAPSHVRNFVALARAGYYDGLFFDRICHEENEVEPGKVQVFESIEAGCPLGTGEPGNGSIGYWLKPEFSKPHPR